MTSTGLTLTSPVENDLYIAGIIFWCTQKKMSRGCFRVRPDANANANANADANRNKTICQPPLKGVDIMIINFYTVEDKNVILPYIFRPAPTN